MVESVSIKRIRGPGSRHSAIRMMEASKSPARQSPHHQGLGGGDDDRRIETAQRKQGGELRRLHVGGRRNRGERPEGSQPRSR